MVRRNKARSKNKSLSQKPILSSRFLNSIRSVLLLFLFVGTACVSPNTLNIKTVPLGATVFIKNPATGKTTKLGRTPTVYRARDNKSSLAFVFELEGYVPREVLVATPYRSQSNLTVNLNSYSVQWFQTLLRTDLSREVDSILNELYDLPITLRNKSDAEAERVIKELRKKYDNFALFHGAVGQYYYSRKMTKKAKVHYLRVLKSKPDDAEAQNMLKLIDSL